MQAHTILHKESPLVDMFRTAGAGLADLMIDHYVSNFTVSDVQKRTVEVIGITALDINPVVPTDLNEHIANIVFDAATHVPQFLTTGNYHKLRNEQPDLFPLPMIEPNQEPRYKRVMSQEEFSRDLLGLENWIKIETAALTSPLVGAWRDITVAGEVSLDHPDLIKGFGLTVSLGIFEQSEIDVFMEGIEIK